MWVCKAFRYLYIVEKRKTGIQFRFYEIDTHLLLISLGTVDFKVKYIEVLVGVGLFALCFAIGCRSFFENKFI